MFVVLWCLCMYVWLHVCVHVWVCMYESLQGYVCLWGCICMSTCMFVCMCVFLNEYVPVCMSALVWVYVYVYLHMCGFFFCVCVPVSAQLSWHVCKADTLQGQLSPSTRWGMERKIRLSVLVAGPLPAKPYYWHIFFLIKIGIR